MREALEKHPPFITESVSHSLRLIDAGRAIMFYTKSYARDLIVGYCHVQMVDVRIEGAALSCENIRQKIDRTATKRVVAVRKCNVLEVKQNLSRHEPIRNIPLPPQRLRVDCAQNWKSYRHSAVCYSTHNVSTFPKRTPPHSLHYRPLSCRERYKPSEAYRSKCAAMKRQNDAYTLKFEVFAGLLFLLLCGTVIAFASLVLEFCKARCCFLRSK